MGAQTIVVGDLHGCFDELTDLLDKAGLGAQDRVICVGDLIVKGEKNRDVLDLFISDTRFSSVLGNHDRALLRFWNGVTDTLKSTQEKCRQELEPERDKYAGYLNSLPLFLDLERYVVVHAGVRPGVALEQQSIEDLTELRTLGEDRTNREGVPWYEVYYGEKTVLFGHWPASPQRRGPRAIGLDTGCVYGYSLTAFVVEADKFISVPARRAYDDPRNRVG
jgi:hypothetical protein